MRLWAGPHERQGIDEPHPAVVVPTMGDEGEELHLSLVKLELRLQIIFERVVADLHALPFERLLQVLDVHKHSCLNLHTKCLLIWLYAEGGVPEMVGATIL